MNRLGVILLSSRPWSFLLSVSSVAVGTIMAAGQGYFNLWLMLVVLLGTVLLHAGMNLMNDYFDFTHGVDRPQVATAIYRPHPLVQGVSKPKEVLATAGVIYALAIGVAVYLSISRGWVVAALAAIGCFISYFYTADPINFKGRALGEAVMFFGTGPVMVTGVYYVQTQSLAHAGPVLLISVSIGLWWSLVLVANNLKDIETDRESPGRTVASFLGRGGTIYLYSAMVAAIYLLTGIEIALGIIPLWGLVIFLSLVPLVRLILSFRSTKDIPADADPLTAKVEVLFTVLFVLAFALDYFIPGRAV